MSAERAAGGDEAVSPPAYLDLFGFARTPASVRVVPRTTAWRMGHAFGYLLLCWVAIGVVMWVPPHFPWILTAFFLGIFFFVKYIRQRFTLLALEGTCPKCGAAQHIEKPMRLGFPQRMHCPACQQQLLLIVEVGAERGQA